MSIKAVFKKAGVAMFNSFGDVISDIEYHVSGRVSQYDPISEESIDEVIPVRAAVKTEYRTSPDGTRSMSGNIGVAILQDELRVSPKLDDKIAYNGVSYLITGVDNRASVVWVLQTVRV